VADVRRQERPALRALERGDGEESVYGHKVAFEGASADLLCHNQERWAHRVIATAAGAASRRQMARVRQHSPGDREDGKLEESGVPTALVNAWFNRFGCGIVPTRVTDFQVMLLPAA